MIRASCAARSRALSWGGTSSRSERSVRPTLRSAVAIWTPICVIASSYLGACYRPIWRCSGAAYLSCLLGGPFLRWLYPGAFRCFFGGGGGLGDTRASFGLSSFVFGICASSSGDPMTLLLVVVLCILSRGRPRSSFAAPLESFRRRRRPRPCRPY